MAFVNNKNWIRLSQDFLYCLTGVMMMFSWNKNSLESCEWHQICLYPRHNVLRTTNILRINYLLFQHDVNNDISLETLQIVCSYLDTFPNIHFGGGGVIFLVPMLSGSIVVFRVWGERGGGIFAYWLTQGEGESVSLFVSCLVTKLVLEAVFMSLCACECVYRLFTQLTHTQSDTCIYDYDDDSWFFPSSQVCKTLVLYS